MKKYLSFLIFAALQSMVINAQNMGIKLPVSTLPNTTLDVNGSTAFREGLTLALANGVNNNVVLTDYSHFRITGPTADFSITGFTGGQDGRILTLINATTQLLTVKNLITSTANNQVKTGGSDLILKADGVVMLIYNASLAKWVVSGGSGFVVPGAWLNTFNMIGTTTTTVAEGGSVDVPGTTINFTTTIAASAFITGVGYAALVSPSGTGQGAFSIIVDGVQVTTAFYSSYSANLLRMPVPCTQMYVANLAPGAHTIKLQARNWGSNGTSPTNNPVDHDHYLNRDAVAVPYVGASTAADRDALKCRLSVMVIAL
jgi:hypothetical protein